MKKILLLLFFFVVGISVPAQSQQILGILNILVRINEDTSIKLRYYSKPPIAMSFSSRNTRIATVDPKTGVVKGEMAGMTWVIGKYFDGTCIKSDSTRVVVLKR